MTGSATVGFSPTSVNGYFNQPQVSGGAPAEETYDYGQQTPETPAVPTGNATGLTPDQVNAIKAQYTTYLQQNQLAQASGQPPQLSATTGATANPPPIQYPAYPPQGTANFAALGGAFAASPYDPYAGFIVGPTGAPVFGGVDGAPPTLRNKGTIVAANAVTNLVDHTVLNTIPTAMRNNYAGRGNEPVALIPNIDGVSNLTWQGNV